MITRRDATETTPKVEFDPINSQLTLAGQSYPEDVTKFYRALLEEVKAYLRETKVFRLVLKLSYFNTSSAKYLFDLMSLIEHATLGGLKASVDWHYSPGIEVMREQGEDFSEEFNIPFRLIDDLA